MKKWLKGIPLTPYPLFHIWPIANYLEHCTMTWPTYYTNNVPSNWRKNSAMGEHLHDSRIKLSLKDNKNKGKWKNGMLNEKQLGLYNDWDWQGAKSDKFPTKSGWKWMRHNFLVIENFVSPEVLRNHFGHPGHWSFWE